MLGTYQRPPKEGALLREGPGGDTGVSADGFKCVSSADLQSGGNFRTILFVQAI
jgi:hypothetical protein